MQIVANENEDTKQTIIELKGAQHIIDSPLLTVTLRGKKVSRFTYQFGVRGDRKTIDIVNVRPVDLTVMEEFLHALNANLADWQNENRSRMSCELLKRERGK